MFVRDKTVLKSQVKQNSSHPRWNEQFKFLVHEPEYQVNMQCSWERAASPMLLSALHLQLACLSTLNVSYIYEPTHIIVALPNA